MNNPTSTAADVELDRYIHEYLYVMSTSDLKIVKAQFSIGLKQRIDDVIAARDKQLIRQLEGLKTNQDLDFRDIDSGKAIDACIALVKQERTDDISLCDNCSCMTHTIDGNICGKCGAVKQERTDD